MFKLLTSEMTFSCIISLQMSVKALNIHHSSVAFLLQGQVALLTVVITSRPPERDMHNDDNAHCAITKNVVVIIAMQCKLNHGAN